MTSQCAKAGADAKARDRQRRVPADVASNQMVVDAPSETSWHSEHGFHAPVLAGIRGTCAPCAPYRHDLLRIFFEVKSISTTSEKSEGDVQKHS